MCHEYSRRWLPNGHLQQRSAKSHGFLCQRDTPGEAEALHAFLKRQLVVFLRSSSDGDGGTLRVQRSGPLGAGTMNEPISHDQRSCLGNNGRHAMMQRRKLQDLWVLANRLLTSTKCADLSVDEGHISRGNGDAQYIDILDHRESQILDIGCEDLSEESNQRSYQCIDDEGLHEPSLCFEDFDAGQSAHPDQGFDHLDYGDIGDLKDSDETVSQHSGEYLQPMEVDDPANPFSEHEEQVPTSWDQGNDEEEYHVVVEEDVLPAILPGGPIGEGCSQAWDIMEEPFEGTPRKPNYSPMMSSPREIRDGIYGVLVDLHIPMSDRESSFKCPSKCCAAKHKPDRAAWERQFADIRNSYSTVSKQFYNELVEVFFRDNSWALHRARLREDANSEPMTLTKDSLHMYDNYSKNKYMTRFKHLNMQICLTPFAVVDLCTPKDLFEPSTPADLLAYQIHQNPEKLRKHTLNEEVQCEMYRTVLEGLVSKQKKCFPELQTLTLKISLHAPQATRSSTLTRKVEDRCGITFKVKVLLNIPEFTEHRLQTFRANLDGPGNNFCIETIEPNTLEPRRRMLSPLAGLDGVYRVQVKRRWIVLHRPKGTKPVCCVANDGAIEEDNVLASHMTQRHTFTSVEQMLQSATTNFKLFQVTGLTEYEISKEDVIEILEHEGTGMSYECLSNG
ncbi:hypothetical protein N7G274_008213 [Stereocaulon virgatum]|uniref:Uncharacterized protein n=1 Tax=Stereocaulon virgatum TaxID=373712 RepID=A0ABR3ZZR7_9LECA